MFIEWLYLLVSGDVGGLAELVLNHLFSVFAFGALAYFIFGPRAWLKTFLVAVLVYGVSSDVSVLLGWDYFSPKFAMLYYFVEVSFMVFIASVPRLEKRIPLFEEVLFYSFFIGFNLVGRL